MGLIKWVKEMADLRKDMKKAVEEFKQSQELYLKMTTAELQRLSDSELHSAVMIRTEEKVNSFGYTYEEMRKGISALTEKQRVFYAVNYLECEVNNGGLCQFFVNSSRAVAPYISEYLGIIGADDHKALYDGFVSRYGIDINDLSSFAVDDVADYAAQTERYPFDEYDDAFYEMKPLEEYLIAFVKENIGEF